LLANWVRDEFYSLDQVIPDVNCTPCPLRCVT